MEHCGDYAIWRCFRVFRTFREACSCTWEIAEGKFLPVEPGVVAPRTI